ncbi:uncharacterized protein LOC117121301 [Anneissia japonica]|uniref:uncharacterized protein LOC117121301 n=1 Tax=Anneissia japonica TaxID=1529436 RepID=UPI0014256502|nr:uncharacterized protein LOC117121301 [Anneissia japonica]
MVKEQIFNISTFNVRGLNNEIKRNQLAQNIINYNVDVACLQETKTEKPINEDIRGGRFINMGAGIRHYGNGFFVHKRWVKSIHKYWKVCERISVFQIKTRERKVICIVNVYAPTSVRVDKDGTELDSLYR